jgi:CSLREA domain-containing protein
LTVRRWIGLGLAALGAALIALALPGAAVPQAGNFVVDTTADGNDGECNRDCTLREAVALADNATGRWVQVPPGVYRLTRTLVVGNDVVFGATFSGDFSSGARTTVIDARGTGRAVEVASGTSPFLAGVTVTGGQADVGAGAFVPDGAQLTLYSSIVTDNVATTRGGGVATAGDLTVYRSLVSGNRASGDGGGISVEPTGQVTAYASTLSGNTAGASGGGIASSSNTTLWNVTVANNRAAAGGGLYWAGTTPATTLWNTIVAGNTGGACGGAVQLRSQWQANIVDDTTCAAALGEAIVTNPQIGPLRNNRGPTDTHALAAGSPAINAGGASLCGTNVDQRGAPPAGPNCDIGAYEFGGNVPEPVLPPPVPGETVNVALRSGTVKVKVAGHDEFFTLRDNQQIPVKSTVDTTKGQITLVAAGRKQKAWFYDGVFKFGQSRGGRPLTTLSLTAKLSCPKGNSAFTAAKRKKRRLWGDGKGRFRTKGSFSSATVRGTKWLTEDRCNGTLTRVTKGTVAVRDFRRKRTVIVRAGQRYLAQR